MRRTLGTLRRFHPIVAIIVVLLCASCGDQTDSRPRSDTPAALPSGPDSVTLVMIAEDTTSVLDLTRRHHDVKSRASLLGQFVTAIDSVENDLTAYWIYSVNDSTPGVASDKYLVSPGDTVRWHLRRTTPTP